MAKSLEATFPSGIRCTPNYYPRSWPERAWTLAANGDSFCYSTIEEDKGGAWIVPEYTGGSNYSGGSVTESNYRVIKEECESEIKRMEADGQTPPLFYVDLYGGHGTYSLAFLWSATPDAIREILIGLEDYPVADEDDLSHLEMDQRDEAWDSWAKSDYRSALEEAHAADLSDVTDDDLFEHFRAAAEDANEYWEDQSGAGQWIDIDAIVKRAKVRPLPGSKPQEE